jgi:group I intron endonuclease
MTDIENISNIEAKKLILEKEQFYINTLKPEFNILKIAGSRLGSSHSNEARKKLSESRKGKYVGEENPFFGKNHTSDVIAKLSLINTGENNPMFGRTGDKNILSKKVYVYDKENPTILFKEFSSYTEAAIFFNCHKRTINRYIDKKIFFIKKGFYLLS